MKKYRRTVNRNDNMQHIFNFLFVIICIKCFKHILLNLQNCDLDLLSNLLKVACAESDKAGVLIQLCLTLKYIFLTKTIYSFCIKDINNHNVKVYSQTKRTHTYAHTHTYAYTYTHTHFHMSKSLIWAIFTLHILLFCNKYALIIMIF